MGGWVGMGTGWGGGGEGEGRCIRKGEGVDKGGRRTGREWVRGREGRRGIGWEEKEEERGIGWEEEEEGK